MKEEKGNEWLNIFQISKLHLCFLLINWKDPPPPQANLIHSHDSQVAENKKFSSKSIHLERHNRMV